MATRTKSSHIPRRSIFKGGLFSAAALGLVGPQAIAADEDLDEADDGHDRTVVLEIHDVKLELIDGKEVFMWAFSLRDQPPSVPGPVIRIRQGLRVRVRVRNNSSRPHDFQILGMGPAMGRIQPGRRGEFLIEANQAGTYMYVDPDNAPVNRVLGLHGIIVVDTPDNRASNGRPMPFPASQAPAGSPVDQLFSWLGRKPFPGRPWRHGPNFEKVWVFNQVDERWCRRAEQGEEIQASEFVADFKPRYFTLNGLSGYDSVHDADCVPTGAVGEPVLLRTANAGLAWHSPHIHGNHLYEVSSNYGGGGPSAPVSNVVEIDTWTLGPLSIADYILPFRKPPDIPAGAWPPAREKFPFSYPMHCHNEISQTSGGGSYPMGLMVDWVLTSP